MNLFSKILYSFLILAAIISCGKPSSNTETSEEAIDTNAPVQWLTFGDENTGSNIVLVSGDEEYRSEEALPQLAKILANHHGFKCKVLFAQDPALPGIVNPNHTEHIPGLDALKDADLMILFTRFRDLPNDQMQQFEQYLKAGKPLIGIRTSTHAFNIKDSTSNWSHWGNYYSEEGSAWDGGFGRMVLGERWHTHHGHHKHQSTRGLIAPGADNHPITNGISDGSIWGPTDVYGVRLPLPGDSQYLIMGQVVTRAGAFDENDPFFGLKPTDVEVASTNEAGDTAYNPNDPMMPIAWTKSYQIPNGESGISFTSTIGSSTDMGNEEVRRLLVNASYFLLDKPVPDKAKVDLVGSYTPSAYSFHDDEYWKQKNLSIEALK